MKINELRFVPMGGGGKKRKILETLMCSVHAYGIIVNGGRPSIVICSSRRHEIAKGKSIIRYDTRIKKNVYKYKVACVCVKLFSRPNVVTTHNRVKYNSQLSTHMNLLYFSNTT